VHFLDSAAQGFASAAGRPPFTRGSPSITPRCERFTGESVSRNDKTISDVEFRLREQRPVSVPPCSIPEIVPQARQPSLRVLQLGECRDRPAHSRVQVGPRTAPIGTEKAIGAIIWNWDHLHLSRADDLLDLVHRRKDRSIDLQYLGKLVLHQPEACMSRVPRENHHAIAGNAFHLRESLLPA